MTIAREQRDTRKQACRGHQTNKCNRAQCGWMDQQHVQRE